VRHFQRATLLGRSLQQFPSALRPELLLFAENRGQAAIGLPELYNRAINQIEGEATLVFLHDDVFLHDWNLAFHLRQAMQLFDVIGLAGSSGAPYGQPGWIHGLDSSGSLLRSADIQMSGSVNHFDPAVVRPDHFGPAPMACDLLDGLFLAASLSRLRETGLRFDPQFRFHCYDTDFCYSARALGLRLGTWPIPVTHGSPGSFDAAWIQAARLLMDKLAPDAN
jgi:GT2 family glycosyltransferase